MWLVQKTPRRTDSGRMESSADSAQKSEANADASMAAATDAQPGTSGELFPQDTLLPYLPCSNRSLILRSPACGWSEAVRIWCSGAKLQERTSGQFNLDIAKFAKIAEESKSQAGQVPEPAQKVPSPREQAAKPVRRDWNAQVHPTLDVQHFCTCCW